MPTPMPVQTDLSTMPSPCPAADAYARDDYKHPEWEDRLLDAVDCADIDRGL